MKKTKYKVTFYVAVDVQAHSIREAIEEGYNFVYYTLEGGGKPDCSLREDGVLWLDVSPITDSPS